MVRRRAEASVSALRVCCATPLSFGHSPASEGNPAPCPPHSPHRRGDPLWSPYQPNHLGADVPGCVRWPRRHCRDHYRNSCGGRNLGGGLAYCAPAPPRATTRDRPYGFGARAPFVLRTFSPRAGANRALVLPMHPHPSPLPSRDVCTTIVIPAKAGIQRGRATGRARVTRTRTHFEGVLQTSHQGRGDSWRVNPGWRWR